MHQPTNALNVYSIKNLYSALRVCICCYAEETVVRVPVCAWARWGHHIHCPVSVWRADGRDMGGGVTWMQWPPGSVMWTPSWTVMKSDCLIRGKQKCCQSDPDSTSTTAALAAREIFHQAGPSAQAAVHLWDIDDGKAPGFYSATANGL